MGKNYNPTPLVPSGHFEYQNRPVRDVFWTFLYLTAVLASVAGGVYGILNWNPVYVKTTTKGYLSDDKNCPIGQRGHARLLQAIQGAETTETFDLGYFFRHAGYWLLGSAILSLVVGFVFLKLFRHKAVFMTRFTIATQILVPLALGAYIAAKASVAAGTPFLFLAVVLALLFYLWRDFVDLCGRLLGVACEGLNANPGLIFFILLQKIVLLVLVLGLLAVGGIAFANGEVVPNPAREGRSSCVDDEGQAVSCCVWQPDSWVPPYWALVTVTILWSTLLAFCMRLFVISGTIAQWYFAPPTFATTRGTTLRSVRHAFGPSFGSLCFGSSIITVVEMVKSATSASEENSSCQGPGALLAHVARMLLSCIASLIEYLTKYAVVRMAITGEQFLRAGRSATELLVRNALKSVGVWWFPPVVIRTAVFVLSVCWGIAVWCVSHYFWRSKLQGRMDAIALAVLAALMALLVLSFFGSVLLNCVDAVYMCYAMDRDTGTNTRPEVHEVFFLVPNLSTGRPVQQPGGEYAYGHPNNPYANFPDNPHSAYGYIPTQRNGANNAPLPIV